MKVYSLKTNGSEHNVPIPNNGKNIYIKFVKNYWKDKLAYYRTDIASLIESIEKSKYFLSGDIKLVDIPEEQIVSEERAAKIAAELAEQKAKEEAEAAAKQNTVVHAEVTKFQEAKKILQAEPYKVAHQALGSPDKVFKKAAELGISFPNLKIDEE